MTIEVELPRPGRSRIGTARLDFSSLHVLRTRSEYQSALRALHGLLDLGTDRSREEADLLDFLSVLVEAYESEHDDVIPEGTPQEIVRLMVEQHGVSSAELARLMGGRARVSEFLSGKRGLSRAQMLELRQRFHVPVDVLIR